MLKIALWPIVISLIALLLTIVFSRKGNIVSSTAKSLKPSSGRVVPWTLALLILVFCGGVWGLHESRNALEMAMIFLGFFIVLCLLFFGVLVCSAFDIVNASAPTAAEIGEQLSDDEKRSLLRHSLKWFSRFRAW